MDPHMKRAEHAVLPAPDALRARIDMERMYTEILQRFQQNCKNDDRHRIDTRMGFHTTPAVNWTARGKRMCQQAQIQIAAEIAYSKSYYEYTFIQHIFAHCLANMKKLQRDIADANAAEMPEYADILSNRMVFYQKQVVALQMELVRRQGVPANALTGQLQVPSMHAIECEARGATRTPTGTGCRECSIGCGVGKLLQASHNSTCRMGGCSSRNGSWPPHGDSGIP